MTNLETEHEAKLLESEFAKIVEDVTHLAREPKVINSLIGASDPTLDKAISQNLSRIFSQGYYIYDSSFKEITKSKNLESLDLEGSLFSVINAGRVELFEKTHGGKYRLYVAAPIKYYNTPQGALIVKIDIRSFAKEKLSIRQERRFVVHVNETPIFSNLKEKRSKTSHSNRFSYRKDKKSLLRKTGLELGVELLRTPYKKAVKTSMSIFLLLLIISIGISFWISAKMSNRISSPILQLSKRVEESRTNREVKCFPLNTGDELDDLAKIFDEKSSELEKINMDLENRVIMRTKELEVARDEAQAASNAKSLFLANMSHEIRTPMNSIIGIGDLLLEEKLDSHLRKHVETICSAGDTLLTIINDVLDFSKIESQELKLEEIPFNLTKLTASVMTMMQPLADSKGLQLITSQIEEMGAPIVGDPARIRQILINLIGNAIKFTDKGKVSVAVVQVEKNLEFSISDTGIGIPEDQLVNIFNKFSQADSSITRTFGGTGLGLSISKQLIEAMQGKLWVESEPKVGSKFSFRIPIIYAKSQEVDPSLSEIKTLEKDETNEKHAISHNILVVDDYEPNRTLIHTYLRKCDQFQLYLASDGFSAIEEFENNDFSLVLMDIQMPGIDGYETTTKIRSIEKSQSRKKCTVIALSAHALSDSESDSLAAGCDAHLTKPIKKKKLITTIQSFLKESEQG